MKKDELIFGVATYNADPFCIENDELIDEVWETIQEEGYHEIDQDTEDYEIGCAQLDIDPEKGIKIYATNDYTIKFAYEF